MRRRSDYIDGILPFIVAELIQIIVFNGLVVLYDFAIGPVTPTVSYLFGFLGVLLCGIIFFFWYRKELQGEVRGSFHNLFTGKMIALFLALGVGLQYFSTGLLNLLKAPFAKLFNDYANRIASLTDGNEILVILLTVIVAPVAEELIFRGLVLHKTSRVIPFMGANLLQAALFGIYHLNVIQGIYAAFIGYILGLIYRKFQNILAPILLHAIINTSAFLVMLLPEHTVFYVASVIAGGLLIITSMHRMKSSELVR